MSIVPIAEHVYGYSEAVLEVQYVGVIRYARGRIIFLYPQYCALDGHLPMLK
jgi:hypothetical protein